MAQNVHQAVTAATSAVAAAQAGQTTQLAGTGGALGTQNDPADTAVAAYVDGTPSQCGQIGVTPDPVTPTTINGTTPLAIVVDDTCNSGTVQTDVAAAVSAEGYGAAYGSNATGGGNITINVSGNGTIAP